MHFIAMGGTSFEATGVAPTVGPAVSNGALSMIVAVSSFLISGASLLNGVSFFVPAPAVSAAATVRIPPPALPVVPTAAPGNPVPIPYERNGRTRFAQSADIAAIRADGHYTVLYCGKEQLFCPWSITDATTRLAAHRFIRTHRSYLINPAHVRAFQRTKDTGVCLFDTSESMGKVPVSRSRLGAVRRALGA